MERTCVKCTVPVEVTRRGMCNPCYQKLKRSEMRRGTWQSDWVDAGIVRKHLERLMLTGLTEYQIGSIAGVDPRGLRRLTQGRTHQQIKSDTAKAVLAVPIPDEPVYHVVASRKTYVSSLGTQRRLQSLVAYGYTRTYLAKRVHMDRANLCKTMVRSRVTAETARRIEELFNELQFMPGPSRIAKSEGRKRGWSIPFNWDEDELDSLEYLNPELKYAVEKPLTQREQVKELRYLGFGTNEIAMRLGIRPHVVHHLEQQAS